MGEIGFEITRDNVFDPEGDGPNLYAYVRNNAVNEVDFYGLANGRSEAIKRRCRRSGGTWRIWYEYLGYENPLECASELLGEVIEGQQDWIDENIYPGSGWPISKVCGLAPPTWLAYTYLVGKCGSGFCDK